MQYSWYALPLAAMIHLVLLLSFYFWIKYKHNYWYRRGVYSPPSHWLYGHAYDAVVNDCTISQHLANICKDPSNVRAPIIGVYIFHQPYLLLRDPYLIRQVLVNDFRYFANRRHSMKCQNDTIDKDNLFAIKYPQWTYLRAKLELAFARDRQRGLFRLMARGAENLQSYLEREVSPDEQLEVHVYNLATRFMVDVMVSIVFGVDTNSFEEPDTEIYKRSLEIYKPVQSIWLTYFSFLLPQSFKCLIDIPTYQYVSFFRNLFWKSMNEREISGAKREDFIDQLLKLKKSEYEGELLFAQAMILITSGLETSALTMSYTLLEIARNSQIQARVRQEIRNKIGLNAISFSSVSKMCYLKSVVNETLRMNPPIPFLHREARRDYKIANSDIVIEKGTVVYISLRGLHTNPLYYANPLKYNPDRFNKRNHSKIRRSTYMPFGDGPRMCIGNRIAIMQTMIGLITIMKNYKLSLNPNIDRDRERTSVTIDDGIHVFLKKAPI